MMDIIVHFISRDKFTTGYINFMKLRMTGWEHHFFITAKGTHEVEPVDDRNIYYYDSMKDVMSGRNLQLLRDCQKIIISGVWDTRMLLALRRDFVHKCYLQFWGGDFYGYRFSRRPGFMHPLRSLKWFVRRCIHHQFIKHCAGTISLISADIDELLKVFPNNAKHFAAQMPNDVLEHLNFDALAAGKHEGDTVRILIGNSATATNHHKDTFEKFAHLKDSVIEAGRSIFGEKFKPIVDFIPKTQYVEFLASCDVAVFNHNQQAALGNIWIMMRLGRKIYIRENIATWRDLKAQGAVIYPISELESADCASLAAMPEESRKINIAIAEERISGKPACKEWEAVFND